MEAIRGKIQKIDNIREQFPIDELKEQALVQNDLMSQVSLIQARLELEQQQLKISTTFRKEA